MVKFILFLLGGFLFVAFQQQTEKVAKLTGKILNASADFVVIGYEEERDTLFLASDGTFAFTKELESPDMFMVLVPSCRAYPAVFMENGKVSHIEIDVDSPQDVRITGDLVLGVTIGNIDNGYNFLQSLTNALGTGLAFTLALLLFSGVRARIENCDFPETFKGVPATLIAASIVSLSFMGFSGII